jgi:hypothetical protein
MAVEAADSQSNSNSSKSKNSSKSRNRSVGGVVPSSSSGPTASNNPVTGSDLTEELEPAHRGKAGGWVAWLVGRRWGRSSRSGRRDGCSRRGTLRHSTWLRRRWRRGPVSGKGVCSTGRNLQAYAIGDEPHGADGHNSTRVVGQRQLGKWGSGRVLDVLGIVQQTVGKVAMARDGCFLLHPKLHQALSRDRGEDPRWEVESMLQAMPLCFGTVGARLPGRRGGGMMQPDGARMSGRQANPRA